MNMIYIYSNGYETIKYRTTRGGSVNLARKNILLEKCCAN